MDQVVATKLVNAFMAEPVMSIHPGIALAAEGFGGIPPTVDAVVAGFRQRWGGLWVGGTATLTPSALHFRANSMNKLVHEGQLDVDLDLRAILRVDVEPGFLTKIVALTLPSAVFKLRCWGAPAFADTVARTVAQRRGWPAG